ncbi:MAG: hypothetical protein DRQ35_03200 [Gammaproteobacteria bacterium]|nr:MAG: hypothetical protein DRQ35_03200 [Gammaproteobacteria bacterium]
MSQVIRISDSLYKRLEVHASGFDTPSNVIETILNAYEAMNPDIKPHIDTRNLAEMEPATNLEISYCGISEEEFKQQLLENKKAYIKLYYTSDTTKIKEWKAFRFSSSSSVDGNLRSGYLRGWRDRGIFRAELSIHRHEN